MYVYNFFVAYFVYDRYTEYRLQTLCIYSIIKLWNNSINQRLFNWYTKSVGTDNTNNVEKWRIRCNKPVGLDWSSALCVCVCASIYFTIYRSSTSLFILFFFFLLDANQLWIRSIHFKHFKQTSLDTRFDSQKTCTYNVYLFMFFIN